MYVNMCLPVKERKREREKKRKVHIRRERAMFALFYLKGAD